jgi:dsDNA-specific endonuclease/ATPase MutS2
MSPTEWNLLLDKIDGIGKKQDKTDEKIEVLIITTNNLQHKTECIKTDAEIKLMVQDEIKESSIINFINLFNSKKAAALVAGLITSVIGLITYITK